MGTTVTHEQIVSTIADHLSTNLTSGVTLSYLGEDIDTESITEWAEFYVDFFNHKKSRKSSDNQRKGELLIKIFVKPGSNLYRHWELLKDFKTNLARKYLALKDFNDSGNKVGHLRIMEPRISPKTRPIGEQNRITLYHLEMRFPVWAQEI